jgi:hypothetical protein
MGCKGSPLLHRLYCFYFACDEVRKKLTATPLMPEPEKQFALERHISRIRSIRKFILSEVVIMVERNIGYATPRITALLCMRRTSGSPSNCFCSG